MVASSWAGDSRRTARRNRYQGVIMNRRLIALQLRLQQAMDRDRGATAVEYGLMVALIAAVIITAVTALGTNVAAKFQTVADAIAAAA
jgi:pilus assembly protein Flp/PilA